MISELDKDFVPYAVPIHMAAGALPSPPIPSFLGTCSKHLFLLALPLEAKGLVDPKFPEDGEEGHDDGDAENDNKRPNLRGDVLELAETLRDGVGAVLLLGDGAAQGHGLPHEELGTLAHSHHSRGLHCHHSRWLHGHHASWLHGQGTGGFEQIGRAHV